MDAIRKIEAALPVVLYHHAEADGTFLPSESCVCEDDVYTNNGDDESIGVPLVLLSDALAAIASKDAEIAAMEAEIAVLRESRKFLSNMHHDIIVAMQAAWIEWQRVGDADTAMFWIENTLDGPGLIPGEDEPYASEPQAYFDKNKSEPFPECFCGRPSNQLWMGQGFCSHAHYAEARAALTTQPKEQP